MKINFDEIFNIRQYQPTKYAEKDSQISTNRGYDSLFASKAKKLSPPAGKVEKQSQIQQRKNKIMNTIKTTNRQDIQKFKYYKPSRFDSEIAINNKKPSNKKIQDTIGKHKIQAITERLHKPIQCHKKNCKDLELQSFYQKVKQQHFCGFKHNINHSRSLTETCERLKQPSQLHQRLYWEYKSREFRGMQLENQYQQKRQPNSVNISNGNKPYLKNYVKFYDRLEHEVSRKVKKQNYYQQNPNINSISAKNQGPAFQPNVEISMRSLNMLGARPKITPKKQAHAIKGQGQMNKKIIDEFNASLNNSIQSLNKTQQIIRTKENRIKNRFCEIFNNDGNFQITSDAIQNLNEEEFSILFPLLHQIGQQSNLTVSQFQNIFQQYYQELPLIEKQKLRYRKKQKIEPSFVLSKTQNSGNSRNHTKNRIKKDYLQKIQNFV